MVSLVKPETGHFFYCLIVALTLSQNLRRRSNREKVTRTHSQRFRKPSQVFFHSNIGTLISVLLNSISTVSSIHWGHWGRVLDRSPFIFGSIVMTRNHWLELSVNSLLLKRGVWMVCALFSHTPHVTWSCHMTLWHPFIWVWLCNTCDVTLSCTSYV